MKHHSYFITTRTTTKTFCYESGKQILLQCLTHKTLNHCSMCLCHFSLEVQLIPISSVVGKSECKPASIRCLFQNFCYFDFNQLGKINFPTLSKQTIVIIITHYHLYDVYKHSHVSTKCKIHFILINLCRN